MSDPGDPQNPEVNQLRLFFATPANSIVEIVTYDPQLRNWTWGVLGPHTNHTLGTASNSQLAAAGWGSSLAPLVFPRDSDYVWAIYEDGMTLSTAWQKYSSNWAWTDASCVPNESPRVGITDMPLPRNPQVQTIAATSRSKTARTCLLIGLGEDGATAYEKPLGSRPVTYTWAGGRPLSLRGSFTTNNLVLHRGHDGRRVAKFAIN
ncbi:hypothetical protein F4778DRAFT_780308 [Xylariomycetidae sp. FL2044]|nr:hypothetical protein F4778DRAFT_780308 [Xylariomycetidae sp. FL2044]